MLFNYLKIAWRSLQKNSVYSFINIGGLSIGIASAILIMLWVADEYSYDRFLPKYERTYQLMANQQWTQGIATYKAMPIPMIEKLKDKSSQIEHLTMTNWGEGYLVSVGETRMNKIGLAATEDFFQVVGFTMLKGNPTTALSEPNTIVLTESLALLLFGQADPLNQTVLLDNQDEVKITGVMQDLPKQSSFEFSFVVPFSYYESTNPWVANARNNWDNNSFLLYATLHEGSDIIQVNTQIKDLIKENNPKAPTAQLFMHPMSKWRLHSKFENGVNTGGMIEHVHLFTIIALFVLIIACINFMNLTTAKSENRIREVGIRKSIGSSRRELIFQFLGESTLMVFISSVLALMMVELALPSYNTLVRKMVSIDYSNPSLWALGLAWIVVIGIFSGSYPAFYLSGFKPVQVLKGTIHLGKTSVNPRKVLVTLQFGLSIFLIVGTIVLFQQIQHVKNRDMGYNRENLLLMWTNSELQTNYQVIKNELLNTPYVQSVTKSNSPITRIFSNNEIKWQGSPEDQRVGFSTVATEYDYIQTMGIQLLEGRDFSPAFNDSSSVIINRAAQEIMNMDQPIGQKILFGKNELTIVGVMENVVMDSPFSPVEPLTLIFEPGWISTVTLRLNPAENMNTVLDELSPIFKKHMPSHPFEYRFADADFAIKFTTIKLIGTLAGIFAGLAIFITCLGLFGLAAYTTEQRTKELGIRKVLGASVSGLILLITKDFTKLVLVGFILAAPVAWWYLNIFLERYEYRIQISWWILPLVGLFALAISLIIVGMQAAKAASINPSKSLKSE